MKKYRKSKFLFFIKRLFFIFLSFFYWVFSYLWHKTILSFGYNHESSCVILMYHYVKKNQIKQFCSQINDLLKFCIPVSIDYKGPFKKGNHFVAITFDDGYISFLENALPELEKHDIPCAMFVPTGFIGSSPDWHGNRLFKINDETIMNPMQLKAISEKSVIIGSHGVNHKNLALMESEEFENELLGSKQTLESITGKKTDYLSFPFGTYNQLVLMRAKALGYKRLFSDFPKSTLKNFNEYVAGRVEVYPNEWKFEFRLKILGAYCWLPYAFVLKRKTVHLMRTLVNIF